MLTFGNRLNNRNRKTTLILSLALLALFCSTTLYTVTIFTGRLSNVLQEVISGAFALRPIENPVNLASAPLYGPGTPGYGFVFCAPTAALTINVWILYYQPFCYSIWLWHVTRYCWETLLYAGEHAYSGNHTIESSWACALCYFSQLLVRCSLDSPVFASPV